MEQVCEMIEAVMIPHLRTLGFDDDPAFLRRVTLRFISEWCQEIAARNAEQRAAE